MGDPRAAVKRPSQAQYDQALELYRAGLNAEVIAERVGVEVEVVDKLEHEGWSARGETKALLPFRSMVQDRIVRIRNSELDWAQVTAESVAKTAATRGPNSVMAAQLEHQLLLAWSKKIQGLLKPGEDGKIPTVDVAEMVMPKVILDNLIVLRRLQDPAPDVRVAELFRTMQGDGETGHKSEWEEIIADLASLSKAEQEEYGRTGVIPKPQRELQFPEAPVDDTPP